jgi:hypothetical protein
MTSLHKPVPVDYTTTIRHMRLLGAAGAADLVWDWERGRLTGTQADGTPWVLRLPACLPTPPLRMPRSRYDGHPVPSVGLSEWAFSLPLQPPAFLLILIQAGHAALGHFVEGEASKHKVIKKYMVRGSGKAQVSYLSTRGKSKAGSRVRLANSVRFFEDINEKLIEWNCHGEVTRILLGCPIRLGVLWQAADPPPPFDKTDPRIAKVPFDAPRPDLDTLLHIGRQVCFGWAEGDVPMPVL